LQALYLAALGRPGTVAELDNWVAQLPPGSISLSDAVVRAIERSGEAFTHLVNGWYVHYLGRPISSPPGGVPEQQGWVDLLQSGETEERVLSLILTQQEFYNRAQSLVASGTPDERYVKALYQLLLGREAAAGEIANDVGGLASQGRGA